MRKARNTLHVATAVALALASPASGRAGEEAAAGATAEASGWRWGPSVLLYVPRSAPSYLQPTLTLDRGALHMEGRYNYEAQETGSAWIGWTFSFGEDVKLGLTPMVGGVFGQLNAIAAGDTISVEWGRLTLWHQSEYVLDPADSSQDFFYTWSELSVAVQWLRLGAALQRTRAFQSSTQVQGGPLLGVTVGKLAATVYLFAPGQQDQFTVVAAAATF